MTDQQLLNAMAARGTSLMFSNALKQCGWTHLAGHGWEATREKIEVELSGTNAEDMKSALVSAITDSYLYAHKAVYFWKIPDEVAIDQIVDSLPNWVIRDDNPYRSVFPAPLGEQELRGVTQLGVPTEYFVNSNSDYPQHSLVFCSKRKVAIEERFDGEAIPEVFLQQGYEELIARKSQVFQTFDAICVYPEQGIIELRIDHGHKLAEKDVLKLREGLRNKINNIAAASIGSHIIVGDPINLFPAIGILYLGDDWVVNRIGHANEDGFINANKGRYRDSDVRESRYHHSGEQGVDQLQLWSIGVSFQGFGGIGRPRLLLEGRSALLSSLHPVLHLARILDCCGVEDYQLVRSALLGSWATANSNNIMTTIPSTIEPVCHHPMPTQ